MRHDHVTHKLLRSLTGGAAKENWWAVLTRLCPFSARPRGVPQSYGQYVAGAITDEERQQIVRNSCPGQGACGGMYTANTMACAIEALGLTLPYRYDPRGAP